MESKTPRFDAVIEDYFAKHLPGSCVCPETGETWNLPDSAWERYRDLNVPPSARTPWVQIQRLRAYVTGMDFFTRPLPEGKTLITSYDPESPATLLPAHEWEEKRLTDGFLQPTNTLDPTRSFFEQWKSFSLSLPRPALNFDPKNEKSPWTNGCFISKNEYYCYNGYGGENNLYCEYGLNDKNCCDVTGSDNMEWSYDCARCDDSSHLFFCERCTFSHDLFFCLNCTNCHDCFGSANLKNKQYYFLNEPLSAEEYKKRLAEINLQDHRVLQEWKGRIQQTIWDKAPRKALILKNCERSEGDDLIDCRDVIGVSLLACERLSFGFGVFEGKDSCLLTSALRSERCSSSQSIENGYENHFCSSCTSCIDVEYSQLLLNCQHCFGCIGLQNKKFCIFNRQYTEEEYWTAIDELKTQMLRRGEYGEFFPYDCYLTAFNTSNADLIHPISKEETERRGGRWFDFGGYIEETKLASSNASAPLPERLEDFSQEHFTKTFICEESGRPYRIVKPELEWHTQFRLALPRLHPTIRRKKRATEMYPVKLQSTRCSSCQAPILTRIPLTRGYTLLCELCFEKHLLQS